MKVYIVVGNKEVFGAYTNKEEAEKHMRGINRGDELAGGYGNKATIKEVEVKE